MGDIKHECAVAAVCLKKPLSDYALGGAATYLQVMLEQMQNRGRLSAGVTVLSEEINVLRRHVGPGLVDQVFKISEKDKRKSLLQHLSSLKGIGHNRYATSGNGMTDRAVWEEAQPFLRNHGRPVKEFGLAFNGNITNDAELRDVLKEEGYTVRTSVDTELIMHLLSLDISSLLGTGNSLNLGDLVRKTASRLDGAFSGVVLNGEGNLIAFRDPQGFRPLVWGEDEDIIAVASESLALKKVGITEFNDIPAGGYLIVEQGKARQGTYVDPNLAHCWFEWIYFSTAPSYIERISVDLVRERAGKELAEIEPLRDNLPGDYIVVPVPDTSIPIAQAMADELGVPFVLGIYKSPSFGRGFINKEDERGRIIRGKYTVVRRRIEGKKLIVVEDTVVRGDTFGGLSNYLRANGAKEVHLRSAGPPIKNPCYYGIDFPTPSELIAQGTQTIRDAEEAVKQEMGLDSMKYMTHEGLVRAIGIPRENLCMACVDGKYPTEAGRQRFVQLGAS